MAYEKVFCHFHLIEFRWMLEQINQHSCDAFGI